MISARLRSVPLRPQYSEPQMVPIPEWMPDQPRLGNNGATVAFNAVPKENETYGPWRQQVVESSNAMDARCTGSIGAIDDMGQFFNYFGNATKLYEYSPNTLSDVSKAGGYSSTSVFWDFARYGSDVIATNYADPVQVVTTGQGTITPFADLIASTNKPQARVCGTVGQFLVLGNTNDTTDGVRPRRVWWSGFGDPTDFDPDSATQSDFEDLSDGGSITKIVGGAEYGIVLQEAQLTRLTYVGQGIVFDIEPVDRLRGCRFPRSVISHGRLIFYYSDEGFLMFNGTTSVPIGAGKVDQTFKTLLTSDSGSLLTSTKDVANNLAIWAIPESQNFSTKVFFYNWVTGWWGEGEVAMDELAIGVSAGVLVDDLVGVIIDDEPFASSLIDSGDFKGGQIRIGGIDGDQKVAWFTGSPRKAEIGSTETQMFPGQRSQINSVIPYIDGDVNVQVSYRSLQTESPQNTTEVQVGPFDRAEFRENIPVARYHAFKSVVPAGEEWDNARGFGVYAAPAGDK